MPDGRCKTEGNNILFNVRPSLTYKQHNNKSGEIPYQVRDDFLF